MQTSLGAAVHSNSCCRSQIPADANGYSREIGLDWARFNVPLDTF